MAVEVERHRGRLVPEHLLDDFHVRAGGDGERRCGVPECVWVHTLDAECLEKLPGRGRERRKLRTRRVPPCGAVNTSASAGLPARWTASSSMKKR